MLTEDFQYMIVAYDDYFVPELLAVIIDEVAARPDWELQVIIAAEAYHAETFLCPN